jgi:hypothetical protein
MTDGCVSWKEFQLMFDRARNDRTGHEPKKPFNLCQYMCLRACQASRSADRPRHGTRRTPHAGKPVTYHQETPARSHPLSLSMPHKGARRRSAPPPASLSLWPRLASTTAPCVAARPRRVALGTRRARRRLHGPSPRRTVPSHMVRAWPGGLSESLSARAVAELESAASRPCARCCAPGCPTSRAGAARGAGGGNGGWSDGGPHSGAGEPGRASGSR